MLSNNKCFLVDCCLFMCCFFSFLTCPQPMGGLTPWLQTGVSPPCSLFLLLLHSYKVLDSYKWHGIYTQGAYLSCVNSTAF